MPLNKTTLLDMYWHMLLARRLDERAWQLHKDGEINYHISGIGHEALQVAAAFAIRRGEGGYASDWVAPYYRDLALMLALGYPPQDYLLGLFARAADPSSGGRQMPNHWSFKPANVISVSPVAASQIPHAVGIALAIKNKREDKIVLATSGEGATSQGEWYEAVNWAAVKRLPVVFLVENNQYALSTPQEGQMAVARAADKANGLGLPGVSVDGNDLNAVYDAVSSAAERARKGRGPSLVEAVTYRITPHSSDDDDRAYRGKQEVEAQKKRDPLLHTRIFLETEDVLTSAKQTEFETKARELIEAAVEFARSAPDPDPETLTASLYAEEGADG
jgi:2-oxoisovalerate dehydrogenase E1 component alpha subunit